MLSQSSICRLIETGEIRWDGPVRGDALLCSLGGPLQELRSSATPVDPTDEHSLSTLYEGPISTWNTYVLPPGMLVLAQVRESLALGFGHFGYIAGLSHVARFGLAVHLASPWVEPAFGRDSSRTHLVLELVNHARAPLILRAGMAVAKLKLFEVARGGGVVGDSQYYRECSDLRSRYAAEFGPGDEARGGA